MTVPAEIVGRFVDAAVQNRSEADKLLEQFPDLKSATWMGESPLRFLAIENYAQGVRYLCERGWPIDERDDCENTPLIDAVLAGAVDSVTALLELGADPNAVSQIVDPPPTLRNISRQYQNCPHPSSARSQTCLHYRPRGNRI